MVIDEHIDNGNQKIQVHYIGWQKKWREWRDRDSEYVQPHGWHTNKKIKIGGSLLHHGSVYLDEKTEKQKGMIIATENCYLATCMSVNESKIQLSFDPGDPHWYDIEDIRKFKRLKTIHNKICNACSCTSNMDTFYCSTCGASLCSNDT